MSDFEDRLKEALRSAGEGFRPGDVVQKQRVFLHRRRRRRTAYAGGTLAMGAAAMAAVLVLTSGTTPLAHDEPLPPAGTEVPVITDVIEVGKGPSGIGYHALSGLWVALGSGEAQQIDARSAEVVDTVAVGPPLDDVAPGGMAVWVSPEGSTGEEPVLIDPDTGRLSPLPTAALPGFPGPLDIAVDGDTLWLASEPLGRIVVLVDGGPDRVRYELPRKGQPIDPDPYLAPFPREIAVERDEAWALGSDDVLYRLSRGGDEFEPFAQASSLPNAQHDDLAAGEGAAWVTIGGAVLRVDQATGALSDPVQLEGNYAALAVGDGQVWAMSAFSDDGRNIGWLTQLDPVTAQPIGEPLELGGKPADVTVGGGAVWVSQNETNTVTRVQLRPAQEPAPDTSPNSEASSGPDGGPTLHTSPCQGPRRVSTSRPPKAPRSPASPLRTSSTASPVTAGACTEHPAP